MVESLIPDPALIYLGTDNMLKSLLQNQNGKYLVGLIYILQVRFETCIEPFNSNSWFYITIKITLVDRSYGINSCLSSVLKLLQLFYPQNILSPAKFSLDKTWFSAIWRCDAKMLFYDSDDKWAVWQRPTHACKFSATKSRLDATINECIL